MEICSKLCQRSNDRYCRYNTLLLLFLLLLFLLHLLSLASKSFALDFDFKFRVYIFFFSVFVLLHIRSRLWDIRLSASLSQCVCRCNFMPPDNPNTWNRIRANCRNFKPTNVVVCLVSVIANKNSLSQRSRMCNMHVRNSKNIKCSRSCWVIAQQLCVVVDGGGWLLRMRKCNALSSEASCFMLREGRGEKCKCQWQQQSNSPTILHMCIYVCLSVCPNLSRPSVTLYLD